ncbi:MAG: putative component of type VI protein secretion system [Planctomycetota bacterium]|jgi:predicted component of type VI protein secretion system
MTDPKLSFLIHEPGGSPREVPIEANLGLGRGEACECTLNDQATSSWHAIVKLVEGRLALIDLGSTNHTKVRGGRTLGRGDYAFLEAGQEFLMGRTALTVQLVTEEAGEGTLHLDDAAWSIEEETAIEACVDPEFRTPAEAAIPTPAQPESNVLAQARPVAQQEPVALSAGSETIQQAPDAGDLRDLVNESPASETVGQALATSAEIGAQAEARARSAESGAAQPLSDRTALANSSAGHSVAPPQPVPPALNNPLASALGVPPSPAPLPAVPDEGDAQATIDAPDDALPRIIRHRVVLGGAGPKPVPGRAITNPPKSDSDGMPDGGLPPGEHP